MTDKPDDEPGRPASAATTSPAAPISDEASRITVKGRQHVASNTVFDIYFDHIAEPPDREVLQFLVVAPKNRVGTGVTGVCVLPVVDDRLALVRCYRHPISDVSWEGPKGFIDEGELIEQAAVRELAEETGLSCRAEDLVSFGVVAPEPGLLDGRVALFLALGCTGELRLDNLEIGLTSVGLFEAAEVEAMIEAGAVQDATTLVLYYKYKDFLRCSG